MAFIWDNYFETGIAIVDQQHRGLVDLINEVGPMLTSKDNVARGRMEILIERLFDYAAMHFETEHGLMRSSGLVQTYQQSHEAVHAQFVDELIALRTQMGQNPAGDTGPTLLKFLTGWLTFHILDEDQRMARQIRLIEGGISPADALHQAQIAPPDDQARKALVTALLDLYAVVGERNRTLHATNEKLRAATQQLAETNQSLEQRVEIRTVELKEALRQMERTQSQLLQSEKMAAIGQLAAGVAHEINNPVGFVNSNMGTLKKYTGQLLEAIDALLPVLATLPESNPMRQQAEAVLKRADIRFLRDDVSDLISESTQGLDRVKKIVQDLKDFSHVDQAEWQEADINACLESTLNVARNEIKYKATIEKSLGELPLISCAASEINQVFMNLLVNAAQAIEGQGVIRIRSGTGAERVWVEIEDTGKGMPAEVMKRIFEPFFTTKPVGKGTGLGLSISWDIVVKKHGGQLTVRSEEGKGTCFRIELPIVRSTAEELATQ